VLSGVCLFSLSAVAETLSLRREGRSSTGPPLSREQGRVVAIARARHEALVALAAVEVVPLAIDASAGLNRAELLALAAGLFPLRLVEAQSDSGQGATGFRVLLEARWEPARLETRMRALLADRPHLEALRRSWIAEEALLRRVDALQAGTAGPPSRGSAPGCPALHEALPSLVRRLAAQTALQQGLLLWNGRHYEPAEEALALFDEALALDPGSALGLAQRGQAHADLRRYREALADFDRSLELEPANAEAAASRGNVYYRLGRFDQAIQSYTRALRLDPASERAFNNRGLSLTAQGKYKEALKDFDSAIRLAPKDAVVFFNRGNTYYELRWHALAIIDFTRAIELDPAKVEAYNNRGMVRHDLGQFELAIADFDEALRLDPANARALTNRGLAMRRLGRTPQACDDWQRACALGLEQACHFVQSDCQGTGR
jgi:tetratricopeptide (TPR) repeat protein